MSQLGIQNMGVTANTIEQVFLMASSTATVYDPKSSRVNLNDANYSETSGRELVLQQLWAILKKKFIYTSRDLIQLFDAMFALLISFYLLNFIMYKIPNVMTPGIPYTLSLSGYPKGIVMYDDVNTSHNLAKQIEKFVVEKHGVFMKGHGSGTRTVIESLAFDNLEKYNRDFISAIDVNNTHTMLMYSRERQSLPITVNVYSNALLRKRTDSDQYSIETTTHNIPRKNPVYFGPGCSSISDLMMQLFNSVLCLGIIFLSSFKYFLNFVIMERTNGFYHIQRMSRVTPFIYWLGTFVFDFTLLFIATIIRAVIMKIIFNNMDFIGLHKPFYVYLLVTALCGIALLLFSYISSFCFNSIRAAAGFFVVVGMVALILTVYHVALMGNKGKNFWVYLNYVVSLVKFVLPHFTFWMMTYNTAVIFFQTSLCSYCVESYKPLCEAAMKKFAYFEFPSDENPNALLSLMLGILGQIAVYSVILHLTYTGFFHRKMDKSRHRTVKNKGDDDVQRERDKIQQFKNSSSPKESQTISLLADELHKKFENFTAVSDASFFVERGTCFGLLGVNGAGKTTTFKMLTGEILPTSGDAQIDGFKLSTNKEEYLDMAGYCSQTNCFLDKLTGAEMLSIIAIMRGIRAKDRGNVVNEWISILALEEYKNRRCGSYSGGNKRKLCTAMSFIGNPRVVFLDEPTTGVDPLARRNLYNVMAQSKLSGQTVVLTSHSMEECQSICDKLTIMVSGVMKCIGSVQHLKTRYAQGFTVHFKIFDTYTARDDVPKLKQTIQEIFHPSPVILKDEHLGMLYYQITDTSLRWSVLFEKMENIKSQYKDFVQDYVITDTSLEEVFISFAKNR